MADFIGITMLFVAFGCTTCICYKHQNVSTILFVAFFIRCILALIHVYIAPLPEGKSDAVTFELVAWEMGQDGFMQSIKNFPGIGSYTYPWLVSIFYALTDRSLLGMLSFNVFGGVLAVFYTWKLSNEVWSPEVGKMAPWLVALFPTVAQYSAIPLREVWVTIFLLIALRSVIRWSNRKYTLDAFIAIFWLAVATCFHGGIAITAIVFIVVILKISVIKNIYFLLGQSMVSRHFFSLLAAILSIMIFLSLDIQLPKIGKFVDLFSFDFSVAMLASQSEESSSSANYGNWQVPGSLIDLLWILPLKLLYFLSAPFIWSISEPSHFIGLIDGTVYLFFIFSLYQNRKIIFNNESAKVIFILLIFTIIAFAIGTSNFGTGIRHRAKFFCIWVIILSPFIPKIRLFKNHFR